MFRLFQSAVSRALLPLRCRSSTVIRSHAAAANLTDFNSVVILGKIHRIKHNDHTASPCTTMTVRTLNSYKTAMGYGTKVIHHNVNVFDPELVSQSRDLSVGDRVFVEGSLNCFPSKYQSGVWIHCIVARTLSPHVESSEFGSEQNFDEHIVDDSSSTNTL